MTGPKTPHSNTSRDRMTPTWTIKPDDVTETNVQVNGSPCRVWRKGRGKPVYYLPGFGGLPKWTPFLDAMAESREVVAVSPPGFPGGLGHDALDSHLDWVLATHDLLRGAGMERADLIGVSVGGALAAEMAAIFPHLVRRLVLIAPFGLFDEAEPSADIFAQRPPELPTLLCSNPETWAWLKAPPEGANSVEWPLEQTRAAEAAARYLWPVGDTRLVKRLPRIAAPTLLLWGAEDRVMPFSYARRMADAIGGETTAQRIEAAGHLADLDQPDRVAEIVRGFLR